MWLNRLIIVAALVSLGSASATGQPNLSRLESTLDQLPPAADPAAGSPASGPATPLPGYLGASVDDTPESKGVVITEVKKGAPSEAAGLKQGDIIVAIDGKPCRTLDDLDAALAKATIGTRLNMQIQRSGKTETKFVTLGRRPIEAAPATEAREPLSPPPASATFPPRPGAPAARPPGEPASSAPTLRPAASPAPAPDPTAPDSTTPNSTTPAPEPPASATRDPALELPPPPGGDKPAADPLAAPPASEVPTDPAAAGAPSGRASLGIQVVPLNDETRAQYGVRSIARQGAVIVSVKPGSAAEKAALPVGGVVVAIDGQVVKTSDDLVTAISSARPGQDVELRYYHGDRLITESVKLSAVASRAATPPPPRPGLILGGTDRPLLRKFEDMVESLAPGTAPPPTAGSSIFDPSRLAELHDDIKAMREQLESLDKRVKALEEKAGVNP